MRRNNVRLEHMRITKGFSLIEILVVISIVSLLASITLASFNEARAKARDTRRIVDLQEIRKALELYWDDHEAYPIAADASIDPGPGLLIYWVNGVGGGWSDLESILSPRYMTKLPLDPIHDPDASFGSGYQYEYFVVEDGSTYDLLATLETDHNLSCGNQQYEWHIPFAGSPCSFRPLFYFDRK